MRVSALLILVILASIVNTIKAGLSMRSIYGADDRNDRETRGFKNTKLSTARGFGKRSPTNSQIHPDLIPAEWMAEELTTNLDLARLIVRKFIDVDQDGLVSPIELLRNTACQDAN